MKSQSSKFGITLSILSILGTGATAQSQEIRSVKEIKTIFHSKATGNDYFNRRLRERIANTGVKFVKSPQQADAILVSNGNWASGGFSGEMTIKSRGGKVIWREASKRSGSSNQMVFSQLGDKFRAARR